MIRLITRYNVGCSRIDCSTISALHILTRPPIHELIENYRRANMWRDVQDSIIYPVYCLDAFFNLALVYSVLLCNLYIIFVTGSSVQDIISKIVILDFIYLLQTNMKKDLFQGEKAKKSLKALKQLYNIPGPIFFNEWCRQVQFLHPPAPLPGFLPFLVSVALAMIAYCQEH